MNLRQLEAFRLVMLRGTMTAAAEALHTSQPSISRLIAELEAATGLKLFARHAGRLSPTDQGIAFYREVERSYQGMDALAQSAQEIRLHGSGKLRVAGVPALALSVLPAVVRRFKAAYPKVAISFDMRSEATLRRWLSSAHCDVGFSTSATQAHGVQITPLYQVEGVAVVPAGHRLARKRVLRPADLVGEALILPSHADRTRAHLEQAFAQAGLVDPPSIETPYGAAIVALVAEGLGIGIVNPLVAANAPRERVAVVPFLPAVPYQGFVAVPDQHLDNPLVRAFVALAHAQLAGQGT